MPETAFAMSHDSPAKPSFKDRAHELVEHLPEDADWRDLIYRAAVRQDLEEGLQDSEAGRVRELDEVLREFGVKDE